MNIFLFNVISKWALLMSYFSLRANFANKICLNKKKNRKHPRNARASAEELGTMSEIKFTDEFFWNFSWKVSTKHCFEKTIKMIGYHSRLRDMMGQSCPIYACTSAYHAHYLSVYLTFCGSSKHTLLKQHLSKNLTSRKCRAYRRISYKIWGQITPFKTTWT